MKFQNHDPEFSERNKNNSVIINRYFSACAVLVLTLLLAAYLVPRLLINNAVLVGSESTVQCFLNDFDMSMVMASEFYLERMADILTQSVLADNAYFILFIIFFGLLFMDYISHLVTRFYFIPKKMVNSGHALYHEKPILTNLKSLARYVILFSFLALLVYSVTVSAKAHLSIYQNRHEVIRNMVIEKYGDKKDFQSLISLSNDEINKCLYNPSVTPIDGKSYIESTKK